MIIDYKSNKGFRLLKMYETLNKGELVTKRELSQQFNVTGKTIQRDIDDLRAYLADAHFEEGEILIQYDRVRGGYFLAHIEREWLTNQEVLAVCKIILESRALCKEETNTLLAKLLVQVSPSDRIQVEKLILNEQFHYVPLQHGKALLNIIWELSGYISGQEIIKFLYNRVDGTNREHEVKPVAIMFSEYYFYLIGFMADDSKDYPTVFRVDRIKTLNGTKNKFHIPYRKKFSDGEFRKRVQFMYSGELRKIKFEYSGPSIEAVLDRLPTAEVLSETNGVYIICVEVYGNGIDMWLRSQGEIIRIIN